MADSHLQFWPEFYLEVPVRLGSRNSVLVDGYRIYDPLLEHKPSQFRKRRPKNNGSDLKTGRVLPRLLIWRRWCRLSEYGLSCRSRRLLGCSGLFWSRNYRLTRKDKDEQFGWAKPDGRRRSRFKIEKEGHLGEKQEIQSDREHSDAQI